MPISPPPTAIVTGGSRGIGRAIAAAILGVGGQVMIAGREAERVHRTVDELGRACGDPDRVAGSQADVRNRTSVENLISAAGRRFGRVDTLVNNAGVGRFGDVAAFSDEDWDDIIGTNVTGAFYCSRAAIPWLKKSGGGWIINIASLAGVNPFAGGSAYCASKAALIAFSEALMQEVRQENIRVSVILPGSVNTEFRSVQVDASWKLAAEDIAHVVVDLLAHPARSLPSRVEIRPAKPPAK
jgi:3-oxoacyl-[acyl-carrier protein] reductase